MENNILQELSFLNKSKKEIDKHNMNKTIKDLDKEKIKKNPNILKAVIDKMYKQDKESISGDIIPIFKVFRLSIVVGGATLINPALGIITYLIDTLIEEKVNERHRGTIMAKITNEINFVKEKLDKEEDDDRKKDLKHTLERLEDQKRKMNNYFEEITSYHHDDKDEDENKDDDFNFDESVKLSSYDLELLEHTNPDEYAEYLIETGLIALHKEGFELSENIVGTLRHHAKNIKDKTDSANNKTTKAIDDTEDMISGDKSEVKEKEEVRKQVLNGKMSLSRKIKYLIKIGVPTFLLGPIAGLLTGVVLLARRGKMSIQERRRMIHELDAELEIIDEKIKDADSKGDLKLKYRLMRLKKEVQLTSDKLKWGINVKTDDSAIKIKHESTNLNEINILTDGTKDIYIFLVDTKRLLVSQTIKFFTNSKFNHASISFDKNLQELYSYTIAPINGFTVEKLDIYRLDAYIKVFKKTVKTSQYNKAKKIIQQMAENPRSAYDYLGAMLSIVNVSFDTENMFCSKFVAKVLSDANIILNKNYKTFLPEDFNALNGFEIVYEGILEKYKDAVNSNKESLQENNFFSSRSEEDISELPEPLHQYADRLIKTDVFTVQKQNELKKFTGSSIIYNVNLPKISNNNYQIFYKYNGYFFEYSKEGLLGLLHAPENNPSNISTFRKLHVPKNIK